MRDIDAKPYSPDEMRVAQFFANAGIGGGDDPIGSLIASHEYAIAQRNRYRDALQWIQDHSNDPTVVARAHAALTE